IALELGKSISLTEAQEEDASKQVHVTHARIVTQSIMSQKLKEALTLTTKEQEDADIMKAFKESKKMIRSQPGTSGSDEGTGKIPRVPDESTIIFDTSSEGTGTKDVDAEDEDEETESDSEEIYKYKIKVREDADEEMKDAETVEHENKEKEEMTDKTKADAEKTEDISKQSSKQPLTSSSLSMASNYGTQFLNLSHNDNPYGVLKDYSEAESNPLLDAHIQRATPLITTLPTPPITTDALSITTIVPVSNALSEVELRVAKFEQDVSELKKIDHSAAALA
nr:hypothetical protein [Tanacetum cinerariifolium]